ncbi:hypothetical protein Tco_0766780 [Tanacetum coccineum]
MLASSGGGLILYQAYGNLYSMTERGDGVADIKRRRHALSSDGVRNLATASGLEKDDSNIIPDLLNMCDNDNQTDQNDKECDDEHVVRANLITNLKLDTDENRKIQKQLKKANTSLSHELQECKSALEK